MNILFPVVLLTAVLLQAAVLPALASDDNRIKISNGTLQGVTDPATGIHEFKGIPYAQPPIGQLRWQAPQPMSNWKGVRAADKFGSIGIQRPFDDMVFRSAGMSEDCLYLNIWTPNTSDKAKLPVLVYFYGGGFVSGDGSEYRYDGESMATKGIVAVTVNYRLGVFGFFTHPELTQESPNHASGNYGLLDQVAALRWVKQNIAAFGGDPAKVTIAGESAGSYSVSALMASPRSKGLIARAIGESGSLLGRNLRQLPPAEKAGEDFGASIGATSLAKLRALPALELLAYSNRPDSPHFGPVVDGYFFPKQPRDIYAAGEQAHVPLLVGWNSAEGGPDGILGTDPPTPANYVKDLNALYADRAADILTHYPGSTNDEVLQSATNLASDRFIAYGTWKWFELQRLTGDSPIYRYFFSRPRPGATGASHSVEIEYAMGNLATNKVYNWTPDDYKVSAVMQGYFANFIKTGDPNGVGLPTWPADNSSDDIQTMHIDVNTHAEPDQTEARYRFLDQLFVEDQAKGH